MRFGIANLTVQYRYPLLIKHLLFTSLTSAAEQEVLDKDQQRYSYVTLGKRVETLACALSAMGVEQGSTDSIMEWDSHRYLESYFAVPMMEALHPTENMRLSEDQIVYNINHAGAQVLTLHRDFLALVKAARARLTTVQTISNALLASGFVKGGRPVHVALRADVSAFRGPSAKSWDCSSSARKNHNFSQQITLRRPTRNRKSQK